MDAFKNITSQVKDAMGNSGSHSNAAPAAGQQPQGQKDDYGDKGAEFLNKKYLNDKLSRDQLEKITDGGREEIEKLTGDWCSSSSSKHIPEKFSN
ncbi:hypothetical protein F5Y16DRAFT_395361 [Xylariaceae sp. FL0255]|nr:hypothetical protein F5Y16DRAFT_395361 [Xylariaceae sp. FL0255]